MGANCCIAAKERPQPCSASFEVSAYRTRHSPSWSFRWDNRTHIEDIMENDTGFSNQSSGNIRLELKNGPIAPAEGHTGGDSLSDVFCKVKWQKSDKKMEGFKLSKVHRDQSIGNNSPCEENPHKSLDMATVASDMNTSKSITSTLPLVSKAEPAGPSSSVSHPLCMNTNVTRKSCGSPEHQLYRKISDGSIPSPKNFNERSFAKSRPSSSILSGDQFRGLSHGESSDGWSSSTPSELVATSQRNRWSVVSGLVGSIAASKLSRSNSSYPTAVSRDHEVCKLCSKLLKERSSWNGHELAVVAVLFCGHAYHANCLDSITAESDKYDPPCPVCTHGETCAANLFGKLELKIMNKASKNIVDSDLDLSSKHQKRSTRELRLHSSSSMKDSFSRPFFRRHFSIGSQPSRLDLVSEPTRKKGFWSRHWRE